MEGLYLEAKLKNWRVFSEEAERQGERYELHTLLVSHY